MLTIKATVFLDGSFWVALFERIDKKGYSAARKIFGGEPSDAEVYEFILQHYDELKFGDSREFELVIKRMNPKRLQREVRREMKRVKESSRPSTHAQDYIRLELEKHQKEKRGLSKKDKEARQEKQFLLKQEKRKKKHRGH